MATPVIDTSNVSSSLGIVWQEANVNGNDEPLTVDAYYPKHTKMNEKFIMCFHPGGFTGGKPSNDKNIDMANTYVPQGYIVFCPTYRIFDPKDVNYQNILKAVQDGNNCLEWITTKQKVLKHGLDPNKGIVFGCSAGAIIALHMAYADQHLLPANSVNINAQHDKIIGCVSCWGSMNSVFVTVGKAPVCLLHCEHDPTIPFKCVNVGGLHSCGSGGLFPLYDAIGITCIHPDWSLDEKPWNQNTHGVNSDTFLADAIPFIDQLFQKI